NATHGENAFVRRKKRQRRREYLPEAGCIRRIGAAHEERKFPVAEMPTPIAHRSRIGVAQDDAVMGYDNPARTEPSEHVGIAFSTGNRQIRCRGDLALTCLDPPDDLFN